MEALSAFLGVAYDPAMARPYDDPAKARMTDGVHEMSPQVGDHNFQEHGKVRAEVADRWREEYREDSLGAATRELAARFGYEGAAGPSAIDVAAAAPQALPSLVAISREGRRMKRSVLTGE
jgi:hypothetical protein